MNDTYIYRDIKHVELYCLKRLLYYVIEVGREIKKLVHFSYKLSNGQLKRKQNSIIKEIRKYMKKYIDVLCNMIIMYVIIHNGENVNIDWKHLYFCFQQFQISTGNDNFLNLYNR